MQISPASQEDIDSLTVLINSAYRGDSSRKGWTTEADLLDGSRIDAETLHENFQDDTATILKATNDECEIIACVYLKRQARYLYLGMLTVSPLLQATGIGKQLLRAADDYARQWKLEKITMTVLSTRTELINWYIRHGYTETGKMKPFNFGEKFGVPKLPLKLSVMEKTITTPPSE